MPGSTADEDQEPPASLHQLVQLCRGPPGSVARVKLLKGRYASVSVRARARVFGFTARPLTSVSCNLCNRCNRVCSLLRVAPRLALPPHRPLTFFLLGSGRWRMVNVLIPRV